MAKPRSPIPLRNRFMPTAVDCLIERFILRPRRDLRRSFNRWMPRPIWPSKRPFSKLFVPFDSSTAMRGTKSWPFWMPTQVRPAEKKPCSRWLNIPSTAESIRMPAIGCAVWTGSTCPKPSARRCNSSSATRISCWRNMIWPGPSWLPPKRPSTPLPLRPSITTGTSLIWTPTM